MNAFKTIFGRSHLAVIGMIHVRALPGTPKNKLSIKEITDIACEEATTYKETGIDGIIIENMHDLPYIQPSDMGPEIVASMTRICHEITSVVPEIPCGIQILAGANKEALAVANASDCKFIRAEGFVFSHVADEGLMNACAGPLLRYRKAIGAEHIRIFTDIKKKHSSHSITADVDIEGTAKAADFFLSDGVILTGEATGLPTDISLLETVKKSVQLPILIGSGITLENVHHYVSANGLIVGTFFKSNSKWNEKLDRKQIERFMKHVQEIRKEMQLK